MGGLRSMLSKVDRMGERVSLKQAARAASREAERELILKVLTRTRWNRRRAAQELQISYKALLYKLKQIGYEEYGTQQIPGEGMKRRIITTYLMVFALAFGAAAQTNAAAGADPAKAATLPAPPPEPKSVAGPEYIIGADDALHVSVWKEPDLTATLPVRPDGKISLPLLNDVQAAGLTPMQLADSLTARLKKYV